MFLTEVVQKIKRHILYIFFENLAGYEIMWKNTVEPDRPQMTIWRVRVACCIPKATDTLRISNTYGFSIATVVIRTRCSVTLYVHCLSCSSGLQNTSEKFPIPVVEC